MANKRYGNGASTYYTFRFLKKDLAVLKKYENYFRTAIKYQYSRNLTNTQVDELLTIYERALGKKYPLCKSCGTAKLHFLQEIGNKYFKQTGIEC